MEHFVWNMDPNIFEFGSFRMRWYGILFVGSFFLGLLIMQRIFKREKKDPLILDAMLIYVLVGATLGSRLVHCFFYEPGYYLANPLEILAIWKGGLASHGGLLGSMIALYLFARKYRLPYVWLISRVAIPGVLTAASVRIGNFFNSEILGLPSEVPWAIIFQRIDMIPRHPTQLYEAAAYLTVFALMVVIYKKVTPEFATKILPGFFLFTLFGTRFLIEYTKTRQAAYVTELPFTTGQMLSIPLIIIGLVWMALAFRSAQKQK